MFYVILCRDLPLLVMLRCPNSLFFFTNRTTEIFLANLHLMGLMDHRLLLITSKSIQAIPTF